MSTKSPKIQRRHISGVFLLNKPLGISSNAALQKVRWLYRAQKAGHTGRRHRRHELRPGGHRLSDPRQ